MPLFLKDFYNWFDKTCSYLPEYNKSIIQFASLMVAQELEKLHSSSQGGLPHCIKFSKEE